MRAGRLRHVVSVERLVVTEDDSGVATESWLVLGTRKASVEPISGKEFMESDRQQSDITHKVVMRKNGLAMTTKDRLVYESRTLNIEALIEIGERGREIHAMCKEAV